MLKIKKRIVINLVLLGMLSFVLVGITPLLDSKTVQSHEELESLREKGYVMVLGFPFPFLKQGIPPLDPPMPYSFRFSFWDYKSIDKLSYFYSVGIVFFVIVIIKELIRLFIKRK